MKRRLALALALLAGGIALGACGELRRASDDGATDASAPEGGSAPNRDARGDDDDDTEDSGTPEPPRRSCSGPCPVEKVVATPKAAASVVLDATNVYFVVPLDGIYSCPKAGGVSPAVVGKTPIATPLALANGVLYWTSGKRLLSCPVTGCSGAPTQVLDSPGTIGKLATDGIRLAWLDSRIDSEGIRGCVAAGCSAASVIELEKSTNVRAMAMGAGRVIWIDLGADITSAKNDVTGTGMLIAQLAGRDVTISRDTETAFWISEGDEIASCAVTGCSLTPKTLAKESAARAITVDPTHVYWRTTTTIERCPQGGCTAPEVMADAIAGTTDDQNLAVDETFIYWAERDGIYRRRK